MKQVIALWLLSGALAASTAFNVYHAKSEPEAAAPCATRQVALKGPSQSCCPLVDKLELTAAQKKQFAGCCPAYARQGAELHERLDVLVARLDRELCAQTPQTERIDQLADEIGALRVEELRSRIQSILLVRKTLTPSQLERLVNCCGQE